MLAGHWSLLKHWLLSNWQMYKYFVYLMKKKNKQTESLLLFFVFRGLNSTTRFTVLVCFRTHHTETRKTLWRPFAAVQKVWPNTILDVYIVVNALLTLVGLNQRQPIHVNRMSFSFFFFLFFSLSPPLNSSAQSVMLLLTKSILYI